MARRKGFLLVTLPMHHRCFKACFIVRLRIERHWRFPLGNLYREPRTISNSEMTNHSTQAEQKARRGDRASGEWGCCNLLYPPSLYRAPCRTYFGIAAPETERMYWCQY